MNKDIIFCHTPFQCIAAYLLFLQNDNNRHMTTVVVVDDFANSYSVYVKMKKMHIFEEVLFGDYSKLKNKLVFFASVISPYIFEKVTKFPHGTYSKLYTNNVFGDFENYVIACNSEIEVHLYDEGYSSYLPEYLNGYYKYSLFHGFAYKISKLIHNRKLVSEKYEDLYLFDNRLLTYDTDIKIKNLNIPENKKNLVNYVSKIFMLEGIEREYDKRFIFFEESFFLDTDDKYDIIVFDKISKIIGKDNVIVKLHPRDRGDRFLKYGFITNRQSEIPWEAIVLGLEDKEKVFITFSSGATINYLFFGIRGYKTILLYDLFPEMGEMSESKKKWFGLFKTYYGENVFIPKTEKELKDILVKGKVAK